MLQRDRQFRTQVHQITDACVFAVSFWLAYVARTTQSFSHVFDLDAIPRDAFSQVIWLYLVIFPAAPLVLESQGFYNRPVASSRAVMFWPLLKGCFILTVSLVMLTYIFHQKPPVPRGVMLFFGVISFLLVWLKEELLWLVMRSRVAKAQYRRRVVIAGTPSEIIRFRRMIHNRANDSIEIVAEFNLAEVAPKELVELLHEHAVSGVLVSARHLELERVENVIHLCELEGVEAWLAADFFATKIAHASFDEIFGNPLLVFRTTPEASWQIFAKLVLDIFGALALLLVFAIPMLIIALWIKLTSPGPIFFRQQRSGLNGAPFTIFKFRTMTTNAEQFKHELAAMNEMSGPVFKVTNDPRVTPTGKWLRKSSLDELPQLFNVLRGEMSLVGPRPLPVDEVRRFNDLAHRRRLSVKPGLTCLWQVSGRNKISDFKEWVRLDLEYIDNWSIWLDLTILIRTIPAVFGGAGAK